MLIVMLRSLGYEVEATETAAGALDLVRKPFDRSELSRRIRLKLD